MTNGASNTILIAGGVFQIALVLAVSAWGFRRAKDQFSVLRVIWVVILISLAALPFAALLLWQPPQERETYRMLLFAAVFTPLGISFLLGFILIYREERQKRKHEHRGSSTRTALRARLADAPSPSRPQPSRSIHYSQGSDGLSSPGEEVSLPAEFSFCTREFHQLVIFIAVLCFVGGILAGVIGGHSWRYTMNCALLLPAVFTPLTWLACCRSTHRSYVISREGVILRRYSRDLEQLPWEEIADIRPWPLTLITSSGRRVSFHLGRDEMLRARKTMLQALEGEENA